MVLICLNINDRASAYAFINIIVAFLCPIRLLPIIFFGRFFFVGGGFAFVKKVTVMPKSAAVY